MMLKLRQQAKAEADEIVNYDDYAQEIENMLKKHVAATNIQAEIQAYVSDLGNKNIEADKLTNAEATSKAGAIASKITKQIASLEVTDPYAHKKFSDLVQEAINKTQATDITPQQKYKIFTELKNKIANELPEGIPSELIANITDENIKQRLVAYYGLFLNEINGLVIINKFKLTKQQCSDYAHKFESIIEKTIAEKSLNRQDVARQIKSKILDLLYIDIEMTIIKQLLEQIIKIVDKRLTEK